MPPYRVVCSAGCDRLAEFKIAACWSDGVTQELKTYGLSCTDCLPSQLAGARAKKHICRLTGGESLDCPGIYEIVRGTRDARLCRRSDLEVELSESPSA
jgi:hypothetical protein